MTVLLLFMCLSAGCLALSPRPQPCRSPPKLTGSFLVSTSAENLRVFGKYSYDSVGKRIRLRETVTFDNKTFRFDSLFLYKEHVLYSINFRDRTCIKKPLDVDFHPLEIPKNASLLGQVVLGSSSGPREGLLVNTWVGEIQVKKGTAKYMSTVTEFGCVPVSIVIRTSISEWMVTSFFNNVKGIKDPRQLIPPSFCKDVLPEENNGEDPANFISFF